MSGIIIDQNGIVSKTEARNLQLYQAKEAVSRTLEQLKSVNDETKLLAGKGWDSLRSYVAEVQEPLARIYCAWAEEETGANEKYRYAAKQMPCSVMDEDKFERKIEEYERKIKREKKKEHPSQAIITWCQHMIDIYQGYLEKISDFVRVTRGIYDRAKDFLRLLEQADTEIVKVVFDTQLQSISYEKVDRKWLTEVKEACAECELAEKGISEEAIEELKKQGMQYAEQLEWIKEMEQQGATAEDILQMEKLDYSYADILFGWKELQTEEKPLFGRLLQGSEEAYALAFETDPKVLSNASWEKLTEYSYRLYLHDLEKMEAFTGGILKADQIFYQRTAGDTEMESLQLYRDIYFRNLGMAMQCRLAETTLYLTVEDKNAKKEEEYNHQFKLCGYWNSLLQMTNRSGIHEEDWMYSISLKENAEEGIEYELTHYSPWFGMEIREDVAFEILSSKEIDSMYKRMRMRQMQQEERNIKARIFVSLVGGGMAKISELGVGMLGLIAAGAESASFQIDYVQNTGGVYEAAGEVVSGIVELAKQKGRIERENERNALSWFGIASQYHTEYEEYLAFYGFYDPGKLRTLIRLQNEGLGQMMRYESEEVDRIKKAIDNKDERENRETVQPGREKIYSDEIKEMAKEILEGGYSLFDRTEEKGITRYVMKDFSKFMDAVECINEHTKGEECAEDILWEATESDEMETVD